MLKFFKSIFFISLHWNWASRPTLWLVWSGFVSFALPRKINSRLSDTEQLTSSLTAFKRATYEVTKDLFACIKSSQTRGQLHSETFTCEISDYKYPYDYMLRTQLPGDCPQVSVNENCDDDANFGVDVVPDGDGHVGFEDVEVASDCHSEKWNIQDHEPSVLIPMLANLFGGPWLVALGFFS